MSSKTRFQWIKQYSQWIRDNKKAKKDKHYAKKSFLSKVWGEWFLNIVLLDLDTVSVLVATIFFSPTNFPIPHPWRISYIIYAHFTDPGSSFVDYTDHYLSVYPIRRPLQSFVSCGNQDSTIQGSSAHKCDQRIWWGAINVVTVTIPPIMSGLTPSLKLFLYSAALFW